MNKNWYAVYTKAQCERKVASLLTKRKIENFCPLNRSIISTQNNRRKILHEPLFPSFVFVYITPWEMQVVRQVNDIINFVYWLGKPAVIKTAEIENIQSITNLYYNVSLEKTIVNPNGTVKILEEEELDLELGIVSSKVSKLKITLPSLGYTMITETGKSSEELVNYGLESNSVFS